MRQTYNGSQILDAGICLGYDYCSEHEWGIDKIHLHLGIDKNKQGFDGKLVSNFQEDQFFYKKGKGFSILVHSWFYDIGKIREMSLPDLKKRFADISPCGKQPKDSFAWDEGSFGIWAVTEDAIKQTDALWEAFQKKDIVVWLSGSNNPFGGSGLTLYIASQIPDEAKTYWLNFDIDVELLKKAHEDSGVEKLLAKANKKFFALSPRWNDKMGVKDKTNLVWWLNPYDQKNNDCGWFGIQDLIDWTNDIGPIPKKG
jgi:hypothetical protein